MKGADELVAKLGAHAKRSIDHHVREVHYAEVTDTSPLTAVLHDDDLELDDDDLVLGAAAKKWDKEVGIETGDTLVVRQMRNDDWLVLEVVSENDTPGAEGNPVSSAVELPVLTSRPSPVASTILLYGYSSGGTIVVEAMKPDGSHVTL